MTKSRDGPSKTALRFFHAFRKAKNKPKEPTKEELDDAGLQAMFIEWVTFASSRAIPLHFTDELEAPPNAKTKRCIVPTNITDYIGQILQYFRRKFPDIF